MNRLVISDGTTEIDLLNPSLGFHLDTWPPTLPGLKSGGIYQSSPYSTGRDLTFAKIENLNESMTVHVNGDTQEAVIRRMRDLIRLLDKARNFWVTQWQQTPVYLEMRICEGDTTQSLYATIVNYQLDEIDELYRMPFFTGMPPVVMQDLALGLEMRPWQASVIGVSACISEISSNQLWMGSYVIERTALPVGVAYYIIETNTPDRLLCTDDDNATTSTWQSTDGGTTWALNNNFAERRTYWLINTITGRIVAGVLDGGVGQDAVYYSDNNGIAWNFDANMAGFTIVNAYQSPSTGRVFGWDTNGPDDIYYSDNNGLTPWASLVASIPWGRIWDIKELSTGTLLLVNEGSIQRSTDNGVTWQVVRVYSGALLNPRYFNNIIELDSGEILSPSAFEDLTGSGGIGIVLESVDDGLTWYVKASGFYFAKLLQLNDGSILGYTTLQAGNSPKIIISKDKGYSWNVLYDTGLAAGGIPSMMQTESGRIFFNLDSGVSSIYELVLQDLSMGKSSGTTCNDDLFVANKQNIANLTHIYVDDGGVFGANLLPMTAFPYTLLPAVPVVNDAIYFGIDTTVIDSGPFSSLVFDILQQAISTTSFTITWEYSNGAAGWPALTVTDGTNQFQITGANSVHWTQPAAWAAEAVNGTTGYWIRARLSALVGTLTPPTQQNRNIYAIVNNWLEIAAATVQGELPALARVKLNNRSDKDGVASTTGPSLWENRIIQGLRSYDRGDDFVSFINVSDEQNPFGITITLGTNTTFGNDATTVTGRLATYNPGGAETMATRVTIDFGPTIAADYFGSYHAFLRVQRSAGVSTDFTIRLVVVSGSGGIQFITDSKQVPSIMNYELIDFGLIKMPVNDQLTATDYGDISTILVQVQAASGTPNLLIHDLVLIPTDESFVDSFDNALETDSDVGASGSIRKLLDVDSITSPKIMVQSSVRTVGAELKTAVYEAVAADEFIWQYNEQQRLHFLAAQALLTGTHTGANNAAVLTDAAVDFLACGVKAGMIIRNTTDGSSATITAVTATTVTGTLAGGTDNDWDTNDAYNIVCSHWVAPHEIGHSVQAYMAERYQIPKLLE